MEESDDLQDAIRWLRGNDPRLVELDLQCKRPRGDGTFNRRIGVRGAVLLAEALALNSTMVTLNLTGHAVGDVGAAALADALTCNATLVSLQLGHNEIGDKGASELARALSAWSPETRNFTLTALDLGNNDLSDRGVASLAAALAANTALKELRLHNTGMRDEGASRLAAALSRNTSLDVLWLGGTAITGDGTLALGKALRSCFPPPSRCIALQGVNLGDVAAGLGLSHLANAGNEAIVAALREECRGRVTAVAMALHPRLGKLSPLSALDEGLVRLVCESCCS